MQRQPLPLRVLVISPASIPAAQSRLLQILPIQNNHPNLTFIWRTHSTQQVARRKVLSSHHQTRSFGCRTGTGSITTLYGIMPQFTAKARVFFSSKPNSHVLDMRPLLLRMDAHHSSQRRKAAVHDCCTCACRGLWTCCLGCY
jgi:hypothetical protein